MLPNCKQQVDRGPRQGWQVLLDYLVARLVLLVVGLAFLISLGLVRVQEVSSALLAHSVRQDLVPMAPVNKLTPTRILRISTPDMAHPTVIVSLRFMQTRLPS